VIRRFARFLLIPAMALAVSACGYFSGQWPALKEDPIPQHTATAAAAGGEEADAPPLPGPPQQQPAITSTSQATARLEDYQARLSTLRQQADARMAVLNTSPKTPAAWGRAQTDLSRLARTETDLRTLADAVGHDAAHLAKVTAFAAPADDYRALAGDIGRLLEQVSARRTAAQESLAGNRPADVPEPAQPAAPLPKGNPALTITADADSAAYSQAVSTLVEKAQAISGTNVYSVVAAADDMAARRANSVRSLLEAGGVAETRIRLLTDPAAMAGSVRIYVE